MTSRRGSNWRRWRESSWRRSSSFRRRRRRRSRKGITRSTEVPTSKPSLSLTRILRTCGNNGLEKAIKELEENRFTKMRTAQQQRKHYDFFWHNRSLLWGRRRTDINIPTQNSCDGKVFIIIIGSDVAVNWERKFKTCDPSFSVEHLNIFLGSLCKHWADC